MTKPAPKPLRSLPVEEGCTVAFNGRGVDYTGVVVRIRSRVSRKARRANEVYSYLTNGQVVGIPESYLVAEIVPPGDRKVVWTVPLGKCRRIAAPDRQAEEAALQVKHEIKASHAAVEFKRKDAGYAACEANGLLALKPGASVWVQYRGNSWRTEEKFVKLSGSWQVGIQSHNRFGPELNAIDELLGKKRGPGVRFLNPAQCYASEK